MAKVKQFDLPNGEVVQVEIVEIEERDDPPLFIRLADGAKLRFRVDVLEVGRALGKWDAEGNPLYHVKSANIMTVTDCPEELRKPPGRSAGNGRQT